MLGDAAEEKHLNHVVAPPRIFFVSVELAHCLALSFSHVFLLPPPSFTPISIPISRSRSPRSSLHDMELSPRKIEAVSGLTAGLVTTLVVHPLDLIKVRLQLSSQTATKPFALVATIIDQIRHDAQTAQISRRGPLSGPVMLTRQLYRGLAPNLVGNLAAWSLYFLLYAELKQVMAQGLLLPQSTLHYLGASTVAGLTTSLLTNPLWVLKTRILGKSEYDAGAYRTVRQAVASMMKKEGVASFWKGSIPSMFLVAQGSLQFTFYDHIKDWHRPSAGASPLLSTLQYIYASATAKILSMLVMYPTQVVRSRLQDYNPHNEKRTIMSVCQSIHRRAGWTGFYRGIGANMLRVVPATCITFVSYEGVKAALTARLE